MIYPIATIVNFCSNEARFLKACIEQAKIFSRQVIVVVCDHFFDGTPENHELLAQIYRTFPDVEFLEYPFIEKDLPKRVCRRIDLSHFWFSLSRFLGVSRLESSIEEVLFLDADEVPQGAKFLQWLKERDFHQHRTMKFANYWYFREPCYQALKWEDSPVLIQKSALTPSLLLDERERDALYDDLAGPKKRGITGLDGEPMFHHFSWVRTEGEMLKKVLAWGHRNDRDWASLVKKEFKEPFKGVDFVHGYTYRTIVPPFTLPMIPLSFEEKTTQPRLCRISKEEIFQRLPLSYSKIWKWPPRLFKKP